MVTNRLSRNWWNSKLKRIDVENIATRTGCIRRRRKVDASTILTAYGSLAATESLSLNATAVAMGCVGRTTISKQAVAKKATEQLVAFFSQLLATCMAKEVRPRDKHDCAVFRNFPRVLVQDGTTIALPKGLTELYPGGKNNLGERVATLKIQTTMDLKTEEFLAVDLMPFSRNDQAAAGDILTVAKKGDLIIRDLGYWVLDVLAETLKQEIFVISRYRKETSLFDANTGKPFPLAKRLRKNGFVDKNLLVGATHKVPMRFVAIKLPREVANRRRRELRNNRDRRLNPSKESLYLCGWALFVTNVEPQVCTAAQIAQIYGLRWRIETIFKAWKSGMKLNRMSTRCSPFHAAALIHARLLFILITHASIWIPIINASMKKNDNAHQFSLLKLFMNIPIIMACADRTTPSQIIDSIIKANCCYEKRKRKPYPEILIGTGSCP